MLSSRNSGHRNLFRAAAFIFVLATVGVNLRSWFTAPFASLHIVSWVLLLGSLGLAVHGFMLLAVIGQPQGRIDKTTVLVTVGAYRYIRHPLYASLLLLAWGAFLKQPSLPGTVLAAAATASLIATARAEEVELSQKFGSAYAEYRKSTKMFIPYVF